MAVVGTEESTFKKSSALTDEEKEYLKLAKKLRDVLKLEERANGGEKLETLQQEKVASKGAMLKEVVALADIADLLPREVVEKIGQKREQDQIKREQRAVREDGPPPSPAAGPEASTELVGIAGHVMAAGGDALGAVGQARTLSVTGPQQIALGADKLMSAMVTFAGHTGAVWDIDVCEASPAGPCRLVSGSADGRVNFWNADTKKRGLPDGVTSGRPLPASFADVEANVCESLFCGPSEWMSPDFLKALTSFAFSRSSFDVRWSSVAARARVAQFVDSANGGPRVQQRARAPRKAINHPGNAALAVRLLPWLSKISSRWPTPCNRCEPGSANSKWKCLLAPRHSVGTVAAPTSSMEHGGIVRVLRWCPFDDLQDGAAGRRFASASEKLGSTPAMICVWRVGNRGAPEKVLQLDQLPTKANDLRWGGGAKLKLFSAHDNGYVGRTGGFIARNPRSASIA
ncbi:unnamed protein product [Prorocentrum cordatum]|uniref:Uncharacterized protein n=1 Tax=Prorocentrum cordatum TaxID=2364126 RepID=A0ABN9UWJ8_9DINO|nr:unnamed protein product [Polarella glacialis]